jgi:hypothetical protein
MLAKGCKGLCDAFAKEARAMSYCRWSSDAFRCDLYVYESCGGGFRVHVAASRIVGEAPHVDEDAAPEAMSAQINAQLEFVTGAEHVAIDLPHAGETLVEPDLVALRARLVALRELGYRFPDDVLARIDAEIAEAATKGDGDGDA